MALSWPQPARMQPTAALWTLSISAHTQATSATSQEVACLTASLMQVWAQLGMSARLWAEAMVASARATTEKVFMVEVEGFVFLV